MKNLIRKLLARKIGYKPRGFRDVHWCWNLNEPFIIEYREHTKDGAKRHCTGCNMTDFDDWNHPFICTVYKPRWHETYQSFGEWLRERLRLY